jgi:protein TonB
MEANKILKSDVLDILFEDRNKEYGAYELRRKYNRRISLALMITGSLAALIFAVAVLARELEPAEAPKDTARDLELAKLDEPEPPAPEPPPPPPPETPPPPKVELTQFTPPVIKPDEQVKEEEVPPPVTELEDTRISNVNVEGERDLGIATPPVVDEGRGVVATPKVEDENQIFEKVEIEASVDAKSWRRHLESQLQRYIEDAASQGMSPGQYTVHVRFLVEKDGSITDVSALNDPGYGLSKGATDVVKRGPKWNPGEQNGRKVRSYHTQPITFVIAEE